MFYVVSVWLFSRHYISSSVCLDCMLRMRIEVSLPASPWCFVNTKLHDDCIGLKVSSSTLFRFILLAWWQRLWSRTLPSKIRCVDCVLIEKFARKYLVTVISKCALEFHPFICRSWVFTDWSRGTDPLP